MRIGEEEKEPATINENHAELLELHTISPKAGYTQEDVIQLVYYVWVATKMEQKKLEAGNVWFNSNIISQEKRMFLEKNIKKEKNSCCSN